MSQPSALVFKAKKGESIKAFNILGPYDFDVSKRINGLTWFENQTLDNGLDVYTDIAREALPLLAGRPRENKEQALFGETRRWTFLRTPEEVCAFGNFHVYNCFGAVLAHSVVDAGADARVSFTLVTRSTSCVTVTVDGKTVYDSGFALGAPDPAGPPFADHFFEADLKAGGSDVMVFVAKMCRWTNIGFALISSSHDVTARTVLPEGVTLERRQKLEDAANSFEMEREFFYDGDEVAVSAAFDSAAINVSAKLRGCGMERVFALKTGRNVLMPVDAALPVGQYALTVTATDAQSGLATEAVYSLYRAQKSPVLPGRENFEARRKVYLDHLANLPDYAINPNDQSVLYYVCAHHMRGVLSPKVEKMIIDQCDGIRERKDCSDFRLQPLMRLLYWETRVRHISDATLAYMKETVLGFKYWQDEPGNTVMYFSSENHRLLFHVAEYLAGALYPLEVFTNSQQNGLYHTNKARGFIVHWLQERGRYGFTEYHSNSYFNITLSPLLNLWELVHPDDVQLRFGLKQIIEYMVLTLAANTFRGAFATAHSRTYAGPAKHPELENPNNLGYLLFGLGDLFGMGGFATFEIASGPYRPMEIFDAMACDDENRQSFTWQQSRSSDGISPTFAIYRTPYYQMSAMLDSTAKGKCESAMHTAHVGLPAKLSVFWTAPWTVSETSGLRPSYWSGTAVTPRTAQEKNVVAVMYKGTRYNWMTHCYFERARFDRVELRGNWAFGEIEGAYIGIWCSSGLAFADSGVFRGRELISRGTDTVWMCECGDVKADGSFERFMDKLLAAPVSFQNGVVVYDSPSVGRFVMGWEGPITVDGTAIKTRRLPTVTSDWINGEFGQPHLAITYKGETRDLWFD